MTLYELEQVALPGNATLPVRIAWLREWDAIMKGAAYAGLYNSSTRTVSADCASGNCTWPSYESLGICSRCADASDLIITRQSGREVPECDAYEAFISDNSNSTCVWTLPNGLTIDSDAGIAPNRGSSIVVDINDFFNASGTLPSMKLSTVGYSLLNFSLLVLPADQNFYPGARASECSLYWCINTYSAESRNTIFTETLQNSWFDPSPRFEISDSVLTGSGSTYNITPPTGSAKDKSNIKLVDADAQDALRIAPDGFYLVNPEEDFRYSNTGWLGDLLTGDVSDNDRRLASSIDILGEMAHNRSQIAYVFERLANELSIALRMKRRYSVNSDLPVDEGTGEALGVAYTNQTIVKVRWVWLVLPAILMSMSWMLLASTVLTTMRSNLQVWKSNPLALMFHSTLKEHQSASWGHLVEMEKMAKQIRVRLTLRDEGWKVVETEKHKGRDK